METRTPAAIPVSENSKKRVFLGGSSIDAEVICHEIIDVDVEEDCSDVKRSGGNVKFSGKEKDILVGVTLGDGSSAISGPVDGDGLTPVLQSHFDNMDIPTGVEAPIPWMPGPIKEQMPTQFGSVRLSPDCFRKDGQLAIGSSNKKSSEGPSKNWAKKIQEEWKILEKDLPDTIFVRVYETRMDLLRAVIMGADGTPYHDGLFFFDVFFPSNYPNVPPLVHYHSFGLRINPNLYNCGKLGRTTRGDESSLRYNENTFILNLKTMVYSMRRPPKHFEDFVLGYFFQSAQDILVACKAYTDGAQVGSLVRGGVQDVDEGDKGCSPTFKTSLAGFIKTVIDTFKEIGVLDCDKFLHLAERGTTRVVPAVH
ncbi:ubiquitin-conjugating enzyme [Datura stramonium]|uniref:Ubiquitin-conjugating enzyme n=1 Tax=Datura stramonium TaxID=4076 RepID=A0ABS8W4N1_DATST|nr:ubiquitin-conjugating enzyme [Datura stramonium]